MASNKDTTSHGTASTTSCKMLSDIDGTMLRMDPLMMVTVSALNSLVQSADRITLMDVRSMELLQSRIAFHLCGLVLSAGCNGI